MGTDRRAELLVHMPNGELRRNLYRQAGTGKGSFASRVRIATGWKGYKGPWAGPSSPGPEAGAARSPGASLSGHPVTHVIPPSRELLGT
ncbi:hypothetical protein ACWEQC_38500 [Streptomyces shenzhenensis]